MESIKLNALRAIAKRCNDEMNTIARSNLSALTIVSSKYAEQAKLLGFSKTEMMIEIGYINGQLTDRRMQ
jgi:hypothetical protein